MNTRAHHPLLRRHSSPTCMGKFAVWLSRKLQARRDRRLEEETVVCLSAMDTKLVNDIGVDIGKLDELAHEHTKPNAAAVAPTRHPDRRNRS
jgi:hypothetical protein